MNSEIARKRSGWTFDTFGNLWPFCTISVSAAGTTAPLRPYNFPVVSGIIYDERQKNENRKKSKNNSDLPTEGLRANHR